MGYSVLPAGEAFWRPSNMLGVLNTDLGKQLQTTQSAAACGGSRPASGPPAIATRRRRSSTSCSRGRAGSGSADDLHTLAPLSAAACRCRHAPARCSTTRRPTCSGWSSRPARARQHARDDAGAARAHVPRRPEGAAARAGMSDDAIGWFEPLYCAAREGTGTVPWDRGTAHPLLPRGRPAGRARRGPPGARDRRGPRLRRRAPRRARLRDDRLRRRAHRGGDGPRALPGQRGRLPRRRAGCVAPVHLRDDTARL